MTQGQLFGKTSRRRCRDCGARIVFGRDQNGSVHPFDPEPDSTLGNFDLDVEEAEPVFAWLPPDVAEAVRRRGEPLYVDHRNTCEAVERPDYEAPF